MERALVVQRAANKLFAAENAIDKAMADTATLMTEFQVVRQELDISAVFADEATAKAVAALSALATARSAMVACHHELAEAKLRLGIRTKLAGTSAKPPESEARLSDTLRRVG